MDYCIDPARSCEYLNFPAHLSEMKCSWQKFMLTSLASQSERKTKIQIFLTSCRIFTIIQMSFKINDAFTWNGFWTPGTQRPFEGMKMRFAIWRPLVFEKIPVNKRLVTSGTNEASNAPLCIQRRNIVFHNGYRATSTFGRKRAIITVFTIRLTFFFTKSIIAKR